MPDEMDKLLKLMQAGLHDQVGAAKADSEKAKADSQAALEIAAELEKDLQEVTKGRQRSEKLLEVIEIILRQIDNNNLEIRRIKASAGINLLCLRISTMALSFAIVQERGGQEQLRFLKQAIDATLIGGEFNNQIQEVTKNEELDPILIQFAEKFMAMQEPLLEYARKRAEEG